MWGCFPLSFKFIYTEHHLLFYCTLIIIGSFAVSSQLTFGFSTTVIHLPTRTSRSYEHTDKRRFPDRLLQGSTTDLSNYRCLLLTFNSLILSFVFCVDRGAGESHEGEGRSM